MYQKGLELFILQSADKLGGNTIFIFQKDWLLALPPKASKQLYYQRITVIDLYANTTIAMQIRNTRLMYTYKKMVGVFLSSLALLTSWKVGW